jgi:hypothetical protein
MTIEQEVEETVRAEREDLHVQERAHRRYEEAFQHERGRPQLPADDESELQRLHQDLAKRFDPDLERNDVERRRRQPLIQLVNAAMCERDLAALRAPARVNPRQTALDSLANPIVAA